MPICHISFRRVDARRLDRQPCPTCEKPRFFVCTFQHWYGWEFICLKCGEWFDEEGRMERPFRPRWREDNKAAARRMWRAHPDAPRDPDYTEVV